MVGAIRDNDNGDNSGAVYLFQFEDNNWKPGIKIIAKDGNNGDFFGYSVAISGDNFIIGAPFYDSINYGAAYFYHIDNQATSLNHSNNLITKNIKLWQNYPNPFNPITSLIIVQGFSELVIPM